MNGPGTARVLNRLWLVIIAVVTIAVLYLAKVLLLPLAFAILFAFLLAPLVGSLERLRIPRQLASLVVIAGFAILLGTAAWTLFSELVDVVNDLPTYRDNITQKIGAMHVPEDSAIGRANQEIDRLGSELGISESASASNAHAGKKPLGASPDHPVQVKEVSHASHRLDQLNGALEPLMTALLAVVFTFFVLLQREDLRDRLIRLSGDRNVSVMTQAMKDAASRISRYFLLQLLVNSTYATLVCVALYFIGLPHPFLFGAIAGLCRFLPYIGPPVAGSMPTLLALAVFPGWSKALFVVGLFVVLEVVTANYAEPHIYGRNTGLSSLAILLAAAFWTLIWGPVGLVLSVPLTVCLVVMGRHIPSLEFLTVLLGDRPIIPPWTCFYQRLLAGDEREASEILERFVEDKSLEEAFDTVLVPALTASEHDRLQGDLDEQTVRFVRQNAREMIDEAAYREGGNTSTTPTADHPSLHVLCVPVRDEVDELAARMLDQSLKSQGIHSAESRVRHLDELMADLERHAPEVVVLVGLPPVGLTRFRRLYRTLRAHSPRIRLMVSILSFPEDPVETGRQITAGEEPKLFATIGSILAEIRSTARSADQPAVSAPAASGRSAA